MAYQILLADDKPAIAKIISLSLPRDEFQVESVTTGKEALAKLEIAAPHFLLIDVSLPYNQDGSQPERDGLFITRHIKTHPSLLAIKVILLTNAFEPVDDAKMREYMADGVLIKPFDPSELRAKLKSLMTPAMQASAQASPPGKPPGQKTAAVPPSPFADSFPAFTEISIPAPPVPQEASQADEPEIELLSPAAQELADFFGAEVERNEAEKNPPPTPTPLEFPQDPWATEATPPPPTAPQTQENYATATLGEIEIPSFHSAAAEWKPVHPTLANDLSEWQRRDLGQGEDPMSNDFADTADANFEFSQDYLKRIGVDTVAAPPAFSLQSSDAPAHMKHAPVPEPELAPLQRVKPLKPSAPPLSPPPTAAASTAPATPALSAAEMEAILREEARRMCREAADKVAWEVIPELAENIIRRELDKVLKELDESEGSSGSTS